MTKATPPPVQFAAVNEVRRRIIEQIMAGHYPADKALPTTRELSKILGVSTATINRAMSYLQREGWVERHAGRGSFLGPRAVLGEKNVTLGSSIRQGVRIAVTLLPLDFSTAHWHAQGLLQGIDLAASDRNVTVEFLGPCGGDNDKFAKRLEQSSPDFLIFLKPHLENAMLIREAERLKIPFVTTGTRLRDMGIPTVEEDGEGGAYQATKKLIDLGHERIGLVLPDAPAPLWYDRRHGYEKAMLEHFGKLDRNLILWSGSEGVPIETKQVERYFEEQKPTALFLLGAEKLELFRPLIESGKIKIPENTSLIIFDQLHEYYRSLLGNTKVTVVCLPMHGMAQKAVEIACNYKKGIPIPQRTLVPCTIEEGESTRPFSKS